MYRVIIFIYRLINNCSKHKIHHLAASFSYYFILSIPPILMLIFILSNEFLSSSLLSNIAPTIINIFGQDIYLYLINLLKAISINKSINFYTSISVFILILTSSSLFVFTKVSYNNYKNLEKKQNFFLNWIKTRIFSILLTLIVLGFYFTSIIISPIIKKLLNYFVVGGALNVQKYFIDYFVSPFIFSFFFALYIQLVFEKIPIRLAFISGLITSYLGKIANALLFKMIPRTLAGSIFSKAGSSLILLLYIYYIGIIIFIGFETAATLWEIKRFHRGYKWVTQKHFEILYRFNKYRLKNKLNFNKNL